ncbi:serine/arginine repetitive matrix protein 2-like [Thunnus maccoyii]|uniref:serine/arginine repetitive matrix protein 2-like n=1 Tax=Thunnus maccoyii TaxID=8240 RepID=UPI001C4D9857|nr:serine/arginine repetitive matrix protein 2-like [Thunnus maccoyii]
MAGLCWVTVMLAFFLSAENSLAAVNQNKLAGNGDGILKEYVTEGSPAVTIPENQNQNTDKVNQEVSRSDPGDNVTRSPENPEPDDHAKSSALDYLSQLLDSGRGQRSGRGGGMGRGRGRVSRRRRGKGRRNRRRRGKGRGMRRRRRGRGRGMSWGRRGKGRGMSRRRRGKGRGMSRRRRGKGRGMRRRRRGRGRGMSRRRRGKGRGMRRRRRGKGRRFGRG